MQPNKLIFFLLALCFCLQVYAQEFPVLHYTVEDGLPSNTIYSTYKDSKGYLWFASDNGIARYDGTRFEKFTTDDGLADNEIFSFTEDFSGRLWMSTYNGKLCFYKDGIFYTEKNDSSLKLPFKEPFILRISVEKDSSITVLFNDQSKFINIRDNTCNVYKIDTSKIQGITFLIEIQKIDPGRYWLILRTGKVEIDTAGNIISIQKYPGNISFSPYGLPRITDYLFTANGVYSKGQQLLFTFNRGFITNVLYAAHKSKYGFFLGTDHGLFINNDIHCLEHVNVSCISQDAEENYWVSSLRDGVYYFDRSFLKQHIYKGKDKDPVKFSACYDSTIFFTTAGNNLCKIKNGKVSYIFHPKSDTEQSYFGISSAFDIGCDGVYHSFYNKNEVVIRNINAIKPTITTFGNNRSHGIKSAYSAEGYIYIFGSGYIDRITYPETKRKNIEEHLVSFKSWETPYYMTRAIDNTIWYSALNRVYKFAGNHAVLQPQFKNIIFKWFNVFDSYLVGCSMDNKLIICNHPGAQAEISAITDQNCVWGKAYRLDSLHIIVSTNTLYRMITLYRAEGAPKYSVAVLENPILPKNAESICANGHDCYFFKNGTIFSLPINDLLIKPPAPKISFSYLKTGNTVYYLNSGDNLVLPYSLSRNIRISFSALSYSSKDLVYEYSVSKSDNDTWEQIKSQEIDLTNAGYGAYQVKLRARTLESGYSNTASFTLVVDRPWWAAWWFIVLCAAVIAVTATAIILSGIRRSLTKREQQHTVQIGLLKSEYKALNALMNPHFIFNVLNNVQGLINDNDKAGANEYLQTFSMLVRQNMHNISKEVIPLQKEIELLNNYLKLEKLRFKDWLNYIIDISSEIDTYDILIPPLLIQPLVENAILHGLLPARSIDGLVSILITEVGNTLTITVRDNGVGIKTSNENKDRLHESFGLNNVRNRISQLSIIHNKEIFFDIRPIVDKQGDIQGTIAEIRMQV